MDLPLEPWTWTALWPYAAIIIVLGARTFYHFVAPVAWREWAGAGLFQAFVIALYAEMHGFPLTVCVLAGLLPPETPLQHTSGHMRATLLGLDRLGTSVEAILGYSFMLAGALLVVKGLGQNLLFERRPR